MLCRRIDRGRGTAGTHDGEISDNPLDPRAGGESDSVLRTNAERDQADRDARSVLRIAGMECGAAWLSASLRLKKARRANTPGTTRALAGVVSI